MTTTIFIAAGDLSGDIHAAHLARALRRQEKDCRIVSLGGKNLEEASDEFLENLVSLSAFGFWEPLRQYFRLRTIFGKTLLRSWDRRRPDKVVLVDFYGFNIHVARQAFARGIPVYYYISPQVWASRPGRIKNLARYVKKMLVILPFEEELYRRANLDASFVGHPLIDLVPGPELSTRPRAGKPVIGLFPGSRPGIFRRHLPILLEAAEGIRKECPSEFKIFIPANLAASVQGLPFPVVTENDYRERKCLDLAITTSGTVSLENTLLGIPMVVMYRLAWFNYFLARLLVRVPYITMANILAGEPLVPELVQHRARPGNIAREALGLLRDPALLKKTRERLYGLRKTLGEPGVADRAAALILGQ
ncbi:MAG: lipid-A-disaccharide synthase [Endomicrobiales bacterium]